MPAFLTFSEKSGTLEKTEDSGELEELLYCGQGELWAQTGAGDLIQVTQHISGFWFILFIVL